MISRRLLVLALAVLLVAPVACNAFPQAAPPPQFPHIKHLTRSACARAGEPECFSCVTCHSDVTEQARPSRPAAATCLRCHPAGAEWLERYAPLNRPAEPLGRSIRYSHEKHLPLPEIQGQCMKCHSGLREPGGRHFAPMTTCLGCHQGDFDAGRCTRCHQRATLSGMMPTGFLRHDQVWLRRHGLEAARKAKVCNGCHSESQCLDCHDQNQPLRIDIRRPEAIEREFVHRADWLTRHPIEARSQPATCMRCHSVSSCSSCHARRGIAAIAVGSQNPHPRGWVGPDASSANFHGRAAKRDILTCAACHDQGPATNCIRCHRVGGGAGNPHPSGWQSSRSPSSSMCRYCHES